MSTAEIPNYIAFLIEGAGIGFAVCAGLNLRRSRRIAAEVRAIVDKGEQVIAESKARLPYDGEVQLPDGKPVPDDVRLCTDPGCVSRRFKHSHPEGWPEYRKLHKIS
jgi:hypothetical protein